MVIVSTVVIVHLIDQEQRRGRCQLHYSRHPRRHHNHHRRYHVHLRGDRTRRRVRPDDRCTRIAVSISTIVCSRFHQHCLLARKSQRAPRPAVILGLRRASSGDPIIQQWSGVRAGPASDSMMGAPSAVSSQGPGLRGGLGEPLPPSCFEVRPIVFDPWACRGLWAGRRRMRDTLQGFANLL